MFFQILLNRKYIVESCGYSDIYQESPLKELRSMAFLLALLDQCACGGMLEDQLIRKRTHFQSCHPFHHLQITCPGNHKHLNLRRKGRCASAAQYPRDECKRIMMEGITSTDTSEGGEFRLHKLSHGMVFSSMVCTESHLMKSSLFSGASQSLEGLKNSGIAL